MNILKTDDGYNIVKVLSIYAVNYKNNWIRSTNGILRTSPLFALSEFFVNIDDAKFIIDKHRAYMYAALNYDNEIKWLPKDLIDFEKILIEN